MEIVDQSGYQSVILTRWSDTLTVKDSKHQNYFSKLFQEIISISKVDELPQSKVSAEINIRQEIKPMMTFGH